MNQLFFFLFSVYGLQEFYRQPENHTATQGSDTVFLRCIIQNKGRGAVQWTKGGFGLGIEKSLPNWPRYSMIGPSPQIVGDKKIGKIKQIQFYAFRLHMIFFLFKSQYIDSGHT